MPKLLDPHISDAAEPSSTGSLRVGDTWAGIIIRSLGQGPRRYSDLRQALRGTTSAELTRSLRALEREGLLLRTVHTGADRRVEYELTPLGLGVLEPDASAGGAVAASFVPTVTRA